MSNSVASAPTCSVGASVGAPRPPNEAERIRSLCALGILDTPPHERFDRLTRLAARIFGVPIALVSLVETDRQWFKSRVGLDATETPREQSFCAHAILRDEVFVVRDAVEDDRFRNNPLVQGAPEIRFYAGCPIKSPNDYALGTLCVIGNEPRDFQEDEVAMLRDLAQMVEEEIKALTIATVDELTGLTNRRGLEQVAPHILTFCERTACPATLLLFDLDGFKAVNDTHGHAAGDVVLQHFAEALRLSFRNSDVVARLGGDEFCALLSGTGPEGTDRALRELETRLPDRMAPHNVGFSVGVTAYHPGHHASFARLMEEADRTMYMQKRRRA